MLIDDEALALKRLARLLTETGRVEIVGAETDPETALALLSSAEWRASNSTRSPTSSRTTN